MRIVIVTALLAGSLVATAAHAGAYLESTEQELGSKEAPTVSKIWFEGGRMRTERRGHDGGSQLVVFRNQAMYLLDPQTKTYRVIDKATAERMGSQVAEAKKKMDERMAGMPPEQRAKMAAMMAKMGAGAGGMPGLEKPERTLKNTGRTETVAGIRCTVWDAFEDGRKAQELCAASPGSLPGGDEIMKTFREISTMMSSLTRSLGSLQNGTEPWHDMDKINGVPILTRVFANGKAESETRLTVARKESVSGASFDVPAGYTEKKMSFGPGGGG